MPYNYVYVRVYSHTKNPQSVYRLHQNSRNEIRETLFQSRWKKLSKAISNWLPINFTFDIDISSFLPAPPFILILHHRTTRILFSLNEFGDLWFLERKFLSIQSDFCIRIRKFAWLTINTVWKGLIVINIFDLSFREKYSFRYVNRGKVYRTKYWCWYTWCSKPDSPR